MVESNENLNLDKILQYKCFSNEDLKNIYDCLLKKAETPKNIQLKYLKESNSVVAFKGKVCQKFCFYEKPINISINQAKNKIYTI